ncbi:MAG: rubrerythrin [Deltaproteobacteria bacterium]|nr:rubrerythrin [Deltaproteobacteria bacterium]
MVADVAKGMDRLIEVIVHSIPRERESRDVYLAAARGAPTEMTRLLFERLAQDEEGHETKLRAVLQLLQQASARG